MPKENFEGNLGKEGGLPPEAQLVAEQLATTVQTPLVAHPEPGSWFDPDDVAVTNCNIQRVHVPSPNH